MDTPTRTIQLDRPRQLRLDMKAALQFKRATGFSLMKDDLEEKLDEEISLHLIHACLQRDDPGLTFEALVELMDFARLSRGMELVAELIQEFVPEEAKGAAEGPQPDPLPGQEPSSQRETAPL